MGSISPSPMFNPKVFPKLDSGFVEYFKEHLAHRPPTHEVPIETIRANAKEYASPWCLDVDGYEHVFDDTVTCADGATIPVKVYYPDADRFGPGPYSVHINYHGSY